MFPSYQVWWFSQNTACFPETYLKYIISGLTQANLSTQESAKSITCDPLKVQGCDCHSWTMALSSVVLRYLVKQVVT